MRVLFFLLLAANVIALVLFQFAGGRGGEPMKGHEAYQAEKIKLISQAELQARKAPAPESDKSAAPSAVAVESVQCLEWGTISAADTERAKLALQKLKVWDKAVSRKIEKTSGFWVYVPQRKTFADAQKKVAELKALGIQDTFILQENTSWRYAISLGIFSTAEAAEKYLAQLRDKGVRSAVSGPRNRGMEAMVFTLKNLAPDVVAEVGKLKPAFAGSDVKTIDCP